MKWIYPLVLVTTFAGMVFPEVLDFGDLKQYDPRLNAQLDGLGADSIWINQADGGFDIVLGRDLKAKVDGVLQGCGEQVNDKCYQGVVKGLEDAHIQLDKRLERRVILVAAATVATVFQAAVGIIEAVGTLLPEGVASVAGHLPEATPITVSAGGSAVVTVTQAPHPTASLEGAVTPVVTAVTAAAGGFEKGDLAALLDKDMASRLGDFMQRSKECQVGIDFDRQNPSAPGTARMKKRAGGSYGEALCAAQATVGGAYPGGPFNDVLLLNPGGVHFQFAAGPALAAANQFADFVRANAALMGIRNLVDVDQLSNYLFALAIDAIVDKLLLGEKNRIKATLISTGATPTGTSSPGCPDKKSLVCGIPGNEACAMKIVGVGGGNAKKAVCDNGDKKDCECVAPVLSHIYKAGQTQLKARQQFQKLLGKPSTPAENKKPECPIKLTNIPADVFSSTKMSVHNHFCQGWFKDAKKVMTVNSTGAIILPEPHRKTVVAAAMNRNGTDLTRRTPPANAGSYSDFRFELSFTPSKNNSPCRRDCNDAFAGLARTCATSSPGIYMYETGKYDVGCGTFEYKIYNALPELVEYPRYCYKAEELPKLKGDVKRINVLLATEGPCRDRDLAHKDKNIRKGDPNSFIHDIRWDGNVPYQYNVWWNEGCSLRNSGPTEVSAGDPLLEGDGAGDKKCSAALYWNFEGCTANGGRGGRVQLGCLVYEFMASGDKRTNFYIP